MTVIKEVGGRTIACSSSGLSTDLRDCGVRADWYAYVFVGSIRSIKPARNSEKELELVPEESFGSKPPSPLTVLTSQGDCLELTVGSRWLFRLRHEQGKPIILDYAGGSTPIKYAQGQIVMLRRLRAMPDRGFLRGDVQRGPMFRERPVPHARVIAKRTSDDRHFVAIADATGHYEFEPLPPGTYNVTADSKAAFEPDDSGLEVAGGACWDLTLRIQSRRSR